MKDHPGHIKPERTSNMNSKYFWIACLSGAVLTTLVSNLPVLGMVNCLLCAGFWGSALFAVWLYRRLSGALTVRQGVSIGALTGAFAGLFGFLLSFIGLAGAGGLFNAYGKILPADALQGMDSMVSTLGGIVFTLIGVLFNVIFGTIGGWIGGAIFKTAVKPEEKA
jgi:hypothetical protein